jgi:hypothetical protein
MRAARICLLISKCEKAGSWRAHVSGKKAASGAADNAERHGNSLSNKYIERLVELNRADAVL